MVLPNHYARFPIEPIRFMVENLGTAFIKANIIKYVMRADAKNGIEDLQKAQRYIAMLIEFERGNPHWWTRDFKAPPVGGGQGDAAGLEGIYHAG